MSYAIYLDGKGKDARTPTEEAWLVAYCAHLEDAERLARLAWGMYETTPVDAELALRG